MFSQFFRLKIPLRNFLIKLVPKKLIDRKKLDLMPPDLSIRKLGKELIFDVFLTNNLFSILNQDEVEYIVNSHFEGKSNNTYKIYQLLHLSYW